MQSNVGSRLTSQVRPLGWDSWVAVLTSSWWARASSAPRAPITWPPPASACRLSTALHRLRQLRLVRGQRARLGQGARARAAAGAALRRPLAGRSPTELDDDFEYDRKGSVVVAETEAELLASAERDARARRARRGGRGARRRRAAPRGAARRARPPGRRPLSRRRAARAAPGHRRPGPRRGRAAAPSCAPTSPSSGSARGADGRATGVETTSGLSPPDMVVIAAGVWTPALLETAGLTVPVTPRKGQIVVLERSPVVFRRKLSEAGYVAAVEADDAALQIAMVVESTPSGTALLGSSRQHIGFDREVESARRRRDRAPRRALLPGPQRRPRAARLRGPAAADAGPRADHRPVRRGVEHLRRDRPRGRRHRPRAGHRRAGRRLAHRRAVPGADRLVLARTASPQSSWPPRDRADRRRRRR